VQTYFKLNWIIHKWRTDLNYRVWSGTDKTAFKLYHIFAFLSFLEKKGRMAGKKKLLGTGKKEVYLGCLGKGWGSLDVLVILFYHTLPFLDHYGLIHINIPGTHPGGRGGTQQSFISEALPRGPTPFPFTYHF